MPTARGVICGSFYGTAGECNGGDRRCEGRASQVEGEGVRRVLRRRLSILVLSVGEGEPGGGVRQGRASVGVPGCVEVRDKATALSVHGGTRCTQDELNEAAIGLPGLAESGGE